MNRNNQLLAVLIFTLLACFASDAHAVYHPKLGRWMQQDPLGRDITMQQRLGTSAMPTNAFTPRDNLAPSAAGYYDGMSLYEYVGSRPIVKIDPRGLSVTCKYTSGSRVDKEKVSVSYYLGGNPSVGEMMWDKIWTGRTKWRTRYKNKYQCMCKYRCQGTKCVIRATPKGRRRTNILGIEYATVVVNTYKYYAEGSSMSQHASHSDYLAAKQNAADVFGKVTADLLEKGLWPKGDDEGDLEATARALVKDGWSKSISKMIVAEAKKKGGIKGKDAFDKIMKAKLAEYKKKCSGWCSAKLGKEKGS